MSDNEKRQYVRVTLDVPAAVNSADVTIPESEAVLKDISAGGLMIETELKLYTGLQVSLHISIAGDTGPLYGSVVWQKDKESGRYFTGIKLDDTFSEQNDKIIGIIVEKIIKGIKEKYLV